MLRERNPKRTDKVGSVYKKWDRFYSSILGCNRRVVSEPRLEGDVLVLEGGRTEGCAASEPTEDVQGVFNVNREIGSLNPWAGRSLK